MARRREGPPQSKHPELGTPEWEAPLRLFVDVVSINPETGEILGCNKNGEYFKLTLMQTLHRRRDYEDKLRDDDILRGIILLYANRTGSEEGSLGERLVVGTPLQMLPAENGGLSVMTTPDDQYRSWYSLYRVEGVVNAGHQPIPVSPDA